MGPSGAPGSPRAACSSARRFTRAATIPCRRITSNSVDKKNTFIGAALFIAAFAVLIYSNKYAPKHPAPAEIQHEVSRQIAKESPAEAAAGAAEVQSSTAEPT